MFEIMSTLSTALSPTHSDMHSAEHNTSFDT